VLSLALAGFLVLNSLLSLSPLLLLYLPGVFSFIVYLVFYLTTPKVDVVPSEVAFHTAVVSAHSSGPPPQHCPVMSSVLTPTNSIIQYI